MTKAEVPPAIAFHLRSPSVPSIHCGAVQGPQKAARNWQMPDSRRSSGSLAAPPSITCLRASSGDNKEQHGHFWAEAAWGQDDQWESHAWLHGIDCWGIQAARNPSESAQRANDSPHCTPSCQWDPSRRPQVFPGSDRITAIFGVVGVSPGRHGVAASWCVPVPLQRRWEMEAEQCEVELHAC